MKTRALLYKGCWKVPSVANFSNSEHYLSLLSAKTFFCIEKYQYAGTLHLFWVCFQSFQINTMSTESMEFTSCYSFHRRKLQRNTKLWGANIWLQVPVICKYEQVVCRHWLCRFWDPRAIMALEAFNGWNCWSCSWINFDQLTYIGLKNCWDTWSM